ncbi:MAG TPA: leucyl aminopeptidase, partial [Candidatus Corynebacterium gallistercoris]|nr:leucyl aminopeptidase [Candidatus Corynebacterium gallistercoris]
MNDSVTNSTSAALQPTEVVRGAIPQLEAIESLSDAPESVDALVVPTFAGESGMEIAGGPGDPFSQSQQIKLWKALISIGATGEKNEAVTLPGAVIELEAPEVHTIIAVGLGDPDDVTEEDVREAAGVASRKIKAATSEDEQPRGAVAVSTLGIFGTEAALVGHGLGAYSYPGAKKAKPGVDTIYSLAYHEEEGAAARAAVIVEGVAVARDLVNAPANVLYPETYAEFIGQIAANDDVDIEVLDETQLAEQGFGGIIGVGKGSARPPRLVRMTYTPSNAGESTPSVALVG